MLELLGVTPAAGQPATLAIQVGEEEKGWPALSRLVTPQEVVCELLEPIPAQRARLEQVNILAEDGTHDVSGLLTGGMTVQPFAFGGQRGTALRLGFRRLPEQGLRLWFQVAPPEGVARNPFGPWSQAPRTIRWVAEGLGPVEPAEDQTWALSQSGFVELPVLPEWQAGDQGLWWLRLELEEGGCEEQVRLSGLAANRYRAAQQQTWAASHWFTVEPAAGQQVLLEDALAQVAQVAVFLRQAQGMAADPAPGRKLRPSRPVAASGCRRRPSRGAQLAGGMPGPHPQPGSALGRQGQAGGDAAPQPARAAGAGPAPLPVVRYIGRRWRDPAGGLALCG